MKKTLRKKKGGLCNGCGATESRITYEDESGFKWCPWCAHRVGYITEETLKRDAQEDMLLRVGMKPQEEDTLFSRQSQNVRKELLTALFKQRRIRHG